ADGKTLAEAARARCSTLCHPERSAAPHLPVLHPLARSEGSTAPCRGTGRAPGPRPSAGWILRSL
ncbi:MAG: hypothetical protein AVDCRST_MAG89-817, partial [uncultured Gemmatimonadetes bacterium]